MSQSTTAPHARPAMAAAREAAAPSRVFLRGTGPPDPEPFRARVAAALATCPPGYTASATVHVRPDA